MCVHECISVHVCVYTHICYPTAHDIVLVIIRSRVIALPSVKYSGQVEAGVIKSRLGQGET